MDAINAAAYDPDFLEKAYQSVPQYAPVRMPVRSVWPVFTGKAAKKRTSVPYQPEVRRQGGLSVEQRQGQQKRADEREDENATDD